LSTRVAGERLDVHHALRRDAEIRLHPLAVHDLVGLALHAGAQDLHAAPHELHQVLVGGDDRDPPARVARAAGQRRDDVVGLEPLLFEAGDVEGARRVAGERDLRAQVLGHLVAVGLVEVVEVVAEGVGALVEHHRDMGRPVRGAVPLEELPEHVDEAGHGSDGQAVGLPRKRRQRVVGAEDEGRPVDQVQVAALAECHAVLRFAASLGNGEGTVRSPAF
jgi:hypothetical protein